MNVNGSPYLVLRMRGSRTVDPGEHGGKVRTVTILYGSPTIHLWHAIRGAVEFYAVGSVALLLVTGPLIAWLLHRGLLPLRQLAALAAGVSVDAWSFSPPPTARATPELAPLTQALESVLQRLERSFVQQRAFVSDAAHELKTAVAVQKSSLQLLNMKRRSPQEYQAGLERCLADSLRLESLVADMLALARAESATPEDGPQPLVELAECVRQVAMQLETVAALRQVRVTLEGFAAAGAVETVKVSVPSEDCVLLVSNLLLNALQHSPAGSAVEVRLTAEAGSAQLVIRDQGDGISAEALPHVFDRFYRGDPSRTRNTGGTGLGLAIAKAIVTKAGGTIAIASQAETNLPGPQPSGPERSGPKPSGEGTTVTVSLPLFGGA
jgi:signal transduction histidine kinase